MVCEFEITEKDLKNALAAIKKAKKNGFDETTAIMQISSVGKDGRDVFASFFDHVILKTKTVNLGNKTTKMIAWYKIVDGNVVEI